MKNDEDGYTTYTFEEKGMSFFKAMEAARFDMFNLEKKYFSDTLITGRFNNEEYIKELDAIYEKYNIRVEREGYINK